MAASEFKTDADASSQRLTTKEETVQMTVFMKIEFIKMI